MRLCREERQSVMRNCTRARQMIVSLARFVGIVLGLSLCLIQTPAFALITLPFSTTYDCAEQTQFDGIWVTCQGLGRAGDWTTKNGGKEQISSAANYPGGGGGRGQRHWIGNSIDNTNGSGSISYSWNGEFKKYMYAGIPAGKPA